MKLFKVLLYITIFIGSSLFSRDLDEIKKSGELRHLGIPYANFVTGLGDGLDVELMRGFAQYLGVKYVYIPSSWNKVFGDLTGQNVKYEDSKVKYLDKVQIKGDVIANGLTIIPWREEVVNFSTPTFPSSVWVIAKSDSSVNPITPSNKISTDIENVKDILKNKTVLTKPNTCLDGRLYGLEQNATKILIHKNSKKIIEMVPAVIKDETEFTLLDVPDALIALDKWSGEIKVIGPVSQEQLMGVAFRKESPKLLEEFNNYFKEIKDNGTYKEIVNRYYPSIFYYYESFFK